MKRFPSRLLSLLSLYSFGMLTGASSASIEFTNYTHEFDEVATQTQGLPMPERVAKLKARFETLLPGLYDNKEDAKLDRRIAKALDEFPAFAPTYRRVSARFPVELEAAVRKMRTSFPDFQSPYPIYLVHDLGLRDGGSDVVGGRKVMLFGADLIAKYHNDDSLQPFIAHELFHLEHARHFDDCDQYWCPLWQEGMAVYAAALATPGATDHQLLLDLPVNVREQTEKQLGAALCMTAASFDTTDDSTQSYAFSVTDEKQTGPPRYGYYVGYLIAKQAGRTHSLAALAQLDALHARPVIVASLTALMRNTKATCPPPPASAPISKDKPRPA